MNRTSGRPDLRGQSGNAGHAVPDENDAQAIGDWLEFMPDGMVEVVSGKVEVGQGVRTSLAQAVAEELRLPLDRVRLILGDTGLAPYDMGTVGSRSTPVMAARLHKVAASARELLLNRAAERLEVPATALRLADGAVEHPASGRSLRYYELLGGKPPELWSDDAPVTPVEQWTVAGWATPRVNGRDFVTGSHRYTADMKYPGMLHGAVLRAPGMGSRLLNLNSSAAEAMPGVVVVRDGDFTGVVAPTLNGARQALAALRAQWSAPQGIDSAELYDYLRSQPAAPQPSGRWGGPEVVESGSLAQGRRDAAFMLEANYTAPYIAHVPLEPRAALAEWQGDRLTVWTGTQRPFGVRSELAAALGVDEEQVRVIVPDTGSGYGGKHTGDAAVEAARLARGAGKPVRLVWTREEEFRWAYFRPAALIEISSAVDGGGHISAWEYHNYNSGSPGMRPPYRIANQHVAYQPSDSPLRQGSYRALAATANHFARESHIDELAHRAGIDPLQFRLLNLEDERLRAVLLAAAESFGWEGRKQGAGRGCGIACGTEKGSYVATCAEVEVNDGQLRIVRIVEAFECGAIVNPSGLASQVEGAVIMALGGALFEQIEFADGMLKTDRLSRYRVPRSVDIPPITTVLVDRKDLPSAGAGETPIVGPAPAIANAIFAATGQRRRSLPLLPLNGD